MSDSNTVIIQELKNTQAQLMEMQATMMRWMEEQAQYRVYQEKKTRATVTRTDSLPYGWPS